MTKTALLSHIAFVHKKTIGNVCPHCGRNCMTNAELKNHIRNVHELSEKRPYQCGDCEKDFKSESALKRHIKEVI
jgi:DNA-directed RNA polymerase subunit RPC12/RpoP